MMESIGLNSDVQAGGKNFHVQTQYLEPSEKIVSNTFEGGQVITCRSFEVKKPISIPEIKETVNKLHQEMIEEIEILYYISDKVRTIRHAVSNNKLGLVFFKKNLFDDAIREFQKALEIDPNFVEVYLNLGRAYLKKNMLQQARNIFLEGLNKNQNYTDLHNELGYTYFLQKNFKEAVNELNKALELNPDFIDAQLNLSILYLKSILENVMDNTLPSKIERLNKTKSLLINIREKSQHFKAEYINSSLELIEENKYEDALGSLERAKENPVKYMDTDIENEFYLKFMFGGKGKDDQYIRQYTEELQKIIEKYPEYPDLRNNLGIAYLIQCRNLFLNALEEFRNALKINPNYKKAQKNLKLAENDGKGFLILLRAILK